MRQTPRTTMPASAEPSRSVRSSRHLTSPAEGDAVSAAADLARCARAKVKEARDGLDVAQARQQEAIEAAPRTHPALRSATDAVATAAAAHDAAMERACERVRSAHDAAGAVTVAQARLEDLDNTTTPVSDGERAAATERVNKAVRAQEAARRQEAAAHAARDDAASAHAAAEERVQFIGGLPPPASSTVLAARAAVNKAERALRDAQAVAAERSAAADRLRAATDAGQSTAVAVRKRYGSLEEFVTTYLLINWSRWDTKERHEQRWCSRWWDHPEALARLEHVWEAFEVLRREKAPAMSTFWRDHVDHHMSVLTSERGPFEQCDHLSGVHQVPMEWESRPAPPLMFPFDESAQSAQMHHTHHAQGDI